VMLRNFYGWLKVEDSGSGSTEERTLTHGTITHGMQYLAEERRRWPTTYYGRNCGAALAVTELGQSGPVKVGVVGLGTGTFAAYGRKGDNFVFYDINPQVLALATTEFSYLKDSGAKIEVELGDARLSMANQPPQKFDLLVLDAFSSDAIPVHLLTREAFSQYFKHLSPRGVLAVHISNRYLDLKPVVKQAALYFHKEARLVDSDEIEYIGVYSSDWILVANDPAIFDTESLKVAAENFDTQPIRMWTDDFSDLYQILR
jgi:spermidine synthase